MWIFAKHGHYSIVRDWSNLDNLLVRARVKWDIERQFSWELETNKASVAETPDSDYLYRVSLPAREVAENLLEELLLIDYTNFKQEVSRRKDDPVAVERLSWYHRLWEHAVSFQHWCKNHAG